MPHDDLGLSAELMAFTQSAKAQSGKLRDRYLAKFKVHRAYRAIFFGAHVDPAMRKIVLDDMFEASGIGLASPALDHEELACKEGRRRMMLHILGRFKLNENELRNLEQEMERDDDRHAH